jgi:hypothetical protein
MRLFAMVVVPWAKRLHGGSFEPRLFKSTVDAGAYSANHSTSGRVDVMLPVIGTVSGTVLP